MERMIEERWKGRERKSGELERRRKRVELEGEKMM